MSLPILDDGFDLQLDELHEEQIADAVHAEEQKIDTASAVHTTNMVQTSCGSE